MKWFLRITQKTKIALLFAAIFVLILSKNYFDRKNISDLGNTFTAVYEDRLMAESYIFQISDHLYGKKILLDKSFKNTADADATLACESEEKIQVLIADFAKTKLTAQESAVFSNLKSNISELHRYEHNLNAALNNGIRDAGLKNAWDEHFQRTMSDLNDLSGIQVQEGKELNANSERIIAQNTILTQFEFGMLVLIGVMIQVLLFASKVIFPKTTQRHHLN